jgi:hypothetical protein
MDEMITLPFLGYSASKSKIEIFVILTKKSKITIFGPFNGIKSNFRSHFRNQHKKLPYPEIFEKILPSSSRKNMGL